ncbi:cytochrome c oxidase assembly protein [Allokutzneria sp. NRRL B-24872]|uniref:cytochrome c oxidase assembly protein n=1 Tax=Allokutzneria sp. NRRL B-24872 TaxID=1137961 RepID=UPI000A39AEEF|nr:cytochrome c oxidase assembly protein [Allokutzneria sp. NRRL B-24872]
MPEAPTPARGRAAGIAALVLPGVLLALVVAAALTALSPVEELIRFGLPDPGQLTRLGLPMVRTLAEAGAVLCVGSLMFAAFMVAQQRNGRLSADGWAALRLGSWGAFAWFAGAALTVPFFTANAVGKPVSELMSSGSLFVLVGQLEQAKAWVLTALLAGVVAIVSRVVLSWGWTVACLALALVSLLPVAVTGHSATGGSHDVGTNSLIYHLVAMSLWVGGLIALVAHARRGGGNLGLAYSRFSKVALVCWIVMAVSGVLNGLVRLPIEDLFTTTYGLLLVAKIVALGLLGVFGQLQRQRGVKAISDGESRGALLRIGGPEVLLMLATIAIGVALGSTPPPNEAPILGTDEVMIGYKLNGPPTLLNLVLDWRFDLIFGTAAVVLAVLYLAGVRRLRLRGDKWPVGRTVAWLCGCATLLIATSTGIGRYAPAMFSVHMGSHMLLSMLVPILFVLGGPMTLALRAIPPAGKEAPPGPREWLLAFVNSPVSRFLTHPIVALVLFVGSFYGLYFSGLFDAALPEHWAHIAMNLHFIVAGYVFYWPVVGIDPAPRRLPPLGRLGLLFAAIPFHAFFGIALMSAQYVIGQQFYSQLALPWVTDLLVDQRLGGGLTWASGEIPLLVVVIALLVQWARDDEREAKRGDRKAETDGDADLNAYNEMLARLAKRDQ